MTECLEGLGGNLSLDAVDAAEKRVPETLGLRGGWGNKGQRAHQEGQAIGLTHVELHERVAVAALAILAAILKRELLPLGPLDRPRLASALGTLGDGTDFERCPLAPEELRVGQPRHAEGVVDRWAVHEAEDLTVRLGLQRRAKVRA
jgi:hypothetical protein